jgi:hypothetical protein
MAALTVAAKIITPGSNRVIYQFTSVNDGDTFNVGKGKVVSYQMTGNPTTQASAGASIAYVATTGVVTAYPGEDGKGGELSVWPI